MALDDVSISGAMADGNTTDKFSVKVNPSELKVGVEISQEVSQENKTATSYTNVSLSGWTVVWVFVYALTGQDLPPVSHPAY